MSGRLADVSPSQISLLRVLVATGSVRRRALLDRHTLTVANEIHADVTIDWRAAEELSSPLVVLRPRQRVMQGLTPRECDVARLLAQGLANKQIAAELGISTATVKDHVHHILRKTGLQNRAAVVAALMQSSG
jgi:DNA-binding NarL/FixJ family response regulator